MPGQTAEKKTAHAPQVKGTTDERIQTIVDSLNPQAPADAQEPAEKVVTAATVELCGKPVQVKDGAKPCIKKPGHDGDCAMRARNVVDVTKLSLADMAAETFGQDEKIGLITEPGERSEQQTYVDGLVKEAYEEWVKAGKPTTIPAMIKAKVMMRFFLDPEMKQAYVKLLDDAGKLHGVRVRKLPVQKHDSGRFMLPWAAVDKTAGAAKKTEKKEEVKKASA